MQSFKSGLQAAEDALLGHKSGHEPVSGVKGQGTASDPYDAGNATNQPTETQGLAGKHAAGKHAYGGSKVDEGVGGFDDTTGRTTGKPMTGGYASQETERVPGQSTHGTGRVDEGISGVGGDRSGYGDKALRSEMQQGGDHPTMGTGQHALTGSKMAGGETTGETIGGTTGGTTSGKGGATAAGVAGAGVMGHSQQPGMSGMKQHSSDITEAGGQAPGSATYGSDMPIGTSGGYGQGKQSQLGSEYGREPGGGAVLGSGDATGTGHGSQYQQHPSSTTHGQHDTTSGITGGSGLGSHHQHPSGTTHGQHDTTSGITGGSGLGSHHQHPSGTTHGKHDTTSGITGGSGYGGSQQYPSEMKSQTAGGMPSGSSPGTTGYGSSDMTQGAPTTGQTGSNVSGGTEGSGYGGSKYQGAPSAGYGGSQSSSGMTQGTSTTGHMGNTQSGTSGSGHGTSQYPSEMKQGAPTTSQTTSGNMGRSTDTGYSGSQPSATRHDAPTASTSSRTTSSVPSHAPAGAGEYPVKSTGLAAEGGNFDATQPGAGREADRLMDEHRPSKAVQDTSKASHGNTGTTNEPHTGTHESHTSHKAGGIAQKAKEALHIGKHKT